MQPVSHEGGGGIAQWAKSDIYDCLVYFAVFHIVDMLVNMMFNRDVNVSCKDV